MEGSNKTVCNQNAILGYYMMMADIIANLQTAYDKASELLAVFDVCYLGEARDEVMTFLENLPLHIDRLELLYGKLLEFTVATAQTFLTNDALMKQNMEG